MEVRYRRDSWKATIFGIVQLGTVELYTEQEGRGKSRFKGTSQVKVPRRQVDMLNIYYWAPNLFKKYFLYFPHGKYFSWWIYSKLLKWILIIIISSNSTCRKIFWTVFTLKEFHKFQRYLSEPSWIFPRSEDASYPIRHTTHRASAKGSVVVCVILVYSRCEFVPDALKQDSENCGLQAKSSPHLFS